MAVRRLYGVDNGPEFLSQTFVDWCTEHGVAIHYIQPGKPDQNAHIERFSRNYRTEVLNAHLFESIAELGSSRTRGSASIARSGRTTASAGCRPSRFFRGPQPPASLLSNCPDVHLTGKLTHRPVALPCSVSNSSARYNGIVPDVGVQEGAHFSKTRASGLIDGDTVATPHVPTELQTYW